MPYLAPFFDLKPKKSNITEVPWNILYASLFFGTDSTACQGNQHLNSAGQGVKQTDVATFESFFADFVDFYRQYPKIAGATVISRFPNNAPVAVPDEDTAYAYRDIKTHLYVFPPS